MRIAITGATGMIGTILVKQLEQAGHVIIPIVRHTLTAPHKTEEFIKWSPREKHIERDKLEGLDAVIHLAGENIGSGRWTVKRKRDIVNSRVEGTTLLAKTLVQLQQPPRMFLSASAVGYYGHREPQEIVDEEANGGEGFLANVCRKWEQASQLALNANIRVVNMRFGMVLDATGGALGRMLLPFKLGVGGKIGHGKQMMSWVMLEEIPSIVQHILKTPHLSGPVNVVSPSPVSNAEFTRTLGKVLRRPTVFPLPSTAIKLLFGEMGEELLLGGSRVVPNKLLSTGYRFKYPDLHSALQQLFHD